VADSSRRVVRWCGLPPNEAIFFGKITGFAEGITSPFFVHRQLQGRQFLHRRLALARGQPVPALGHQENIRHFQKPQGGHDHRGTGGDFIQQTIGFGGCLARIDPGKSDGRIHDETGAHRRPSPIQALSSAAVILGFPWFR
jgi:hypothetical protein